MCSLSNPAGLLSRDVVAEAAKLLEAEVFELKQLDSTVIVELIG